MIPESPDAAIEWVTVLALGCTSLLAVETLLDHKIYRPDGLLGWPVVQTLNRRMLSSWYAPTLNLLNGQRCFLGVTALRLACAMAIFVAPAQSAWTMGPFVFLAVTSILLGSRGKFGHDGADQMCTLAVLALCIDALVSTPLVRAAVLWFLALQLVLSYATSGVAKAMGREWREGRAMGAILATKMYGLPPLGEWLLRHRGVSFVAGWGVIVGECAFALVFFMPTPVAWVFVGVGFAFHVGTAAIMGLNTFLWAFAIPYPALIWCRFGA